MAERVRDQYVAILVPDHRVTTAALDATDSGYTQAGPIPGVPSPAQATAAVLVASGSQSAAGSLDVRARGAGHAQRDGGAGLVWKGSADAATGWRGWDLPLAWSHWEAVSWGTTTAEPIHPHAITLDDDTILVAASSTSGGTSRASVHKRSAAGSWGAAVYVHTETQVGSNDLYPCLVQLPDLSVLCIMWTFDAGAATASVRVERSTDRGATWALYADHALDNTIGTSGTISFRRLRAAYADGQILLVAHLVDTSRTNDDLIRQWASDSMGARFEVIGSSADTADAASGFPDVLATRGGGFLVGYIRHTDTAAHAVRLGSAFDSIASATSVEIAGTVGTVAAGALTFGDLALSEDESGSAWVLVSDASTVGLGYALVSRDAGATWAQLGAIGGANGYWYSLSTTDYPANYSATWQRGRMVVAHNHVSDGGTYDSSLAALYLGGYSTVTLPKLTRQSNMANRAHWFLGYLPFDVPGGMGWTAAGVAAVETVASGVLDLHTAANVRTYTDTTTTSATQGHLARGVVSVSTGEAGMQFVNNGGYDVEVRLTSAALTVYDNNAAAQVATVAVTGTTKQDILVAVVDGLISCWYRTAGSGEDREYTALCSGSALVGGAAGADSAAWGVINASTTECEWAPVGVALAAYTGIQLAAGQTNPADLSGRPVGDGAVYLDDGVRVSMRGGPAAESDEWAIDADYQYPIRNVCPLDVRSPSRTWRSTSTADQDLVYQLDTIGACDWPSDLLGVWVQGTNASQVLIQTESAPGAGYVTRATVQLWDEVGFTRGGKSVEITSCDGDTPTWSIVDDELVGADWIDGEVAGSTARQITRHTGGHLPAAPGSTNRRPRLYCAAIDGSESAADVGKICFRRALIVVQLAGVQPSSVRVRLEVAANTPAPSKGYIEAAKVVLGPVYVLGWSPSADRSRRQTPTVDVSESPGGQRRVIVRGPVRRSVDVTWSGGVNEAPYYAGTDDYVLASDVASAEPVGMVSDAYALVSGLVEHLDGPAIPCVLIPALPHLTASPTSLIHWRAGGCIYGSIVGDIVATTLLGDEQSDEVTRFGFRFEEEL